MTFLTSGLTRPTSNPNLGISSSYSSLKYGNPNLDPRTGMLLESPDKNPGKTQAKPGGKTGDKGKDKNKKPKGPTGPAYAPTLADSTILFAGLRDMHNPNLNFKLGGRTSGRPTLFGNT